jgi:amidase/aspartyl-tRNA(Asn)/glutamyl-tRNA(Gln) amidotransferase subunit A
MTFSDWQSLSPADAARLVHERVAALPPAQQRAALAWLAPQEQLADELAGTSAPLSGVPFAAKDLFDAAGLPTFAGSAFLPEVRPTPGADGAFIHAVRAAGGALAAKAHMHEFAYGITGENPHYGDCELPDHPGRTTGGSSSGSALLVKAGVVPLALGTDTGGSIRVPAAFCGLYGFRMVPHHAWIADGFPLAESFDTPGFFTAHAADLRITLDALVPEAGAVAGRAEPKGAYLVPPGLAPEVEQAFVAAAARLAGPLPQSVAAGLIPLFAPAAELYAILGGAETRVIHAPFYERYRDRYDANVRARIDRALTLTAAEIARAQANRDAITAAWASLFSEYDYIVLPSTPCAAVTKAECTLETRNRILSCTVPASMGSLPVLALPIALPGTGGLTTGLQVVVRDIHSPAIRHALARHG